MDTLCRACSGGSDLTIRAIPKQIVCLTELPNAAMPIYLSVTCAAMPYLRKSVLTICLAMCRFKCIIASRSSPMP